MLKKWNWALWRKLKEQIFLVQTMRHKKKIENFEKMELGLTEEALKKTISGTKLGCF